MDAEKPPGKQHGRPMRRGSSGGPVQVVAVPARPPGGWSPAARPSLLGARSLLAGCSCRQHPRSLAFLVAPARPRVLQRRAPPLAQHRRRHRIETAPAEVGSISPCLRHPRWSSQVRGEWTAGSSDAHSLASVQPSNHRPDVAGSSPTNARTSPRNRAAACFRELRRTWASAARASRGVRSTRW